MDWLTSRGRAFLYAFLSTSFRDHFTLEKMQRIMNAEDLAILTSHLARLDLPEAPRVSTALAAVTAAWQKADAYQELELQKAYARLFLLPGGVHPYESIYLGNQNLLMDKPWEKVRQFYRNLGLEKDTAELHPEDHIAVELGFMSSLAYMTAAAGKGSRQDLLAIQCEFLIAHLNRWAYQLACDIRGKCCGEDFYWLVSELLDGLLTLDNQAFGEEKPQESNQKKTGREKFGQEKVKQEVVPKGRSRGRRRGSSQPLPGRLSAKDDHHAPAAGTAERT